MNVSTSSPYLTLAAFFVLVGCGPAAEGTPGEETSPCNGGQCLGDLECRSDLCVDPEWTPGSSGAGTSAGSVDTVDPSGAPSSAGTSSDPSETSSPTSGSPSETGDPSTTGEGTSEGIGETTTSGGFTSGNDSECGDGVLSPGEQCDGPDLQGLNCSALGLGTGTLGCDPVVCTFDTSMCNNGSGGTSG